MFSGSDSKFIGTFFTNIHLAPFGFKSYKTSLQNLPSADVIFREGSLESWQLTVANIWHRVNISKKMLTSFMYSPLLQIDENLELSTLS